MAQPNPLQERPRTVALASKVPEVTALFWVVKVFTTGVGETTSDFLVRATNPLLAVGFGAVALAAALAGQFLVRRYLPWVYWLAVVMVSVFGTMAADVVHVGFGVPYLVSTIVFSVVLVMVFMVWVRVEKTISIHSITTRRRETFYWATVLITFALGTAAGDMTAATFHLGFLASGLIFGTLMIVPAVLYRTGRFNAVAPFWIAYVLTRPFGASLADWMGVPPARSGLGWGTGPVSAALALIIVCLVGYLARTSSQKAHTTPKSALIAESPAPRSLS